jgi:predicted lipoprotein with Yx(FWY)xxD motif
MRKSGWAAATGLGSLVLLLAACGSSGTTAATGGASPGGAPSSAASGASGGSSGQVSSSSPATSSSSSSSQGTNGGSSPTSGSSTHQAPRPKASGSVSFPPQGTTFMIVLHTRIGYVLATAKDLVVYTYAKDSKGGAPTCKGACAAQWPPVTGMPKAGAADHFPGTFGVVRGAGGVEQITYEGMPLYVLKGAKPLLTTGNGQGGVWHVIKLSASDIG